MALHPIIVQVVLFCVVVRVSFHERWMCDCGCDWKCWSSYCASNLQNIQISRNKNWNNIIPLQCFNCFSPRPAEPSSRMSMVTYQITRTFTLADVSMYQLKLTRNHLETLSEFSHLTILKPMWAELISLPPGQNQIMMWTYLSPLSQITCDWYDVMYMTKGHGQWIWEGNTE